MRQPISITEIPANQFHNRRLTALCDDGTMWVISPETNNKWELLPSIPQNAVDYSYINKLTNIPSNLSKFMGEVFSFK